MRASPLDPSAPGGVRFDFDSSMRPAGLEDAFDVIAKSMKFE